jgi:hypothetical protein
MTDEQLAQEIANRHGFRTQMELSSDFIRCKAAILEAIRRTREHASDACLDMADRYDADIEGCDADELLRYGEGISASFRLAYIIKYGKFPPAGDAWSTELVERMRAIRAQGKEKP